MSLNHSTISEADAQPAGAAALHAENTSAAQTADNKQNTNRDEVIGFPLILHIDGDCHPINPGTLKDEDTAQRVRQLVDTAKNPAVVILRHLLDWSHEDRWLALELIAGLEAPYRIQADDGPAEGPPDLFEVVLSIMVGDDDVVRCERGRRAALESAALTHPHELAVACSRVAKRLEDLRVSGWTAAKVLKEAQPLAAVFAGGEAGADNGGVLLREALPEAPVPEETVVPAGWEVSSAGVARENSDEDAQDIPAPLVITRRFTNVDGDAESLGLAWLRDGQWQERIVPRDLVAASRTVVNLAAQGAPVTSNNATLVVQYVADFEVENIDHLPRARVARQLGWQGDAGRYGFLWGKHLIGAEPDAPKSLGDLAKEGQPEGDRGTEIVFRGSDDGDEQLAEGFCTAGTYKGWQDALANLADFPRVKLAVYASLAVPLLQVLDAPNFVMSLSGATSQGKTITQRVAASCWGCPDERSPSAAIGTWDATRVCIERVAAAQCDLPLILDDTKRARRDHDIAQTLYDVASGRGRGRGTLDGIRGVATFRTIMITSGEAPICSFSQDGGTRARVLEVWGSPFGRADADTAMIVNTINEGVLANYGHVGPQFVKFLIANRKHWDAWREHYRRLRRRYEGRAGNNSVAARMASHFATLRMTAILAHHALDLPWKYVDVISRLWPELVAETPEADRAAAALRYVLSWVHGHAAEFHNRRAGSQGPPSGGWAGRWEEGFIGILPHKLDEVLREGGFEPQPVRRLWHDRNWLLTTPDKGNRYRCRMGDNNPYVIAILREAIEEVEGPEEADEAEPRIVGFPPLAPGARKRPGA